jgi:hypothetical protein
MLIFIGYHYINSKIPCHLKCGARTAEGGLNISGRIRRVRHLFLKTNREKKMFIKTAKSYLPALVIAFVIFIVMIPAVQAKTEKESPCEFAARIAAVHLNTFDQLDYEVFTGQQWARLHESHSKNVIVHWPDGHQTVGIDKHIEDLKAMFVYAPDTRIKVHTVKFGSGEWTAVIGIMEGTFTKPMPTSDGKFIQPTNKAYKIEMCTIGHWKDGVMDEEYLFWDNLSYMKQLGIVY